MKSYSSREIAEQALEMIETAKAETVAKYYNYDQQTRLQIAQKMVASRLAAGYSEAQAQLFALRAMKAIRMDVRGGNTAFMNDGSERNLATLRDRLNGFGEKAFALSASQFEYAIKGAW